MIDSENKEIISDTKADSQDLVKPLIKTNNPLLFLKTSNSLTVIVSVLVVIISILLAGSVWLFVFDKDIPFLNKREPVNYVIQGVPSVTIYNHINDNAYLVTSKAAAVRSVMEFYGKEFEDEDLREMNNVFYDPSEPIQSYDLSVTRALVETYGFDTEEVRLLTVDDLAQFINEDQQIPLIFSHRLTSDQPEEIKSRSFSVLIGILEDTKEFVFHSYYLGYNKYVSFEEFEKLQDGINPKYKYSYLVIKPKDNSYQDEEHSSYLKRTDSMSRAEPIINKITLSRLASFEKLFDLQVRLSNEAILHPDFDEYVPPYYKIVAYAHAADGPLFLSKPINLEQAEDLIKKAEALNVNLDEPYSDYWPGFVDMTNTIHDVSDAPYYLRGVLYRYQGEYNKAIKSFQRALEVWPFAKYTKYQLKIAEQLKQKKQESMKTLPSYAHDEQVFKRILIQSSPWMVEWVRNDKVRTHKMVFVFNKENIFNVTIFTNSSFLSNSNNGTISVKGIEIDNGCIRLISKVLNNVYEYCLSVDGTLRGTISGGTFVGNAIANPNVD